MLKLKLVWQRGCRVLKCRRGQPGEAETKEETRDKETCCTGQRSYALTRRVVGWFVEGRAVNGVA